MPGKGATGERDTPKGGREERGSGAAKLFRRSARGIHQTVLCRGYASLPVAVGLSINES